jgi:polysaccharide biosynthesis transport protein
MDDVPNGKLTTEPPSPGPDRASDRDRDVTAQYSLQRVDPIPMPLPEDYEQAETGRHLWDYVHVLLRRKWTALTFFLVTVTTVVIGTYLITPIYRATTTLKIEQSNPYVVLFNNQQQMLWQESAGQEYMETQLKILTSKKLARRVIRALGLDRVARTTRAKVEQPRQPPEERPLPPLGTAPQEPPRDTPRVSEDFIDASSVGALLSQINVAVVPKTKLVNVSMDSPDPAFAARAVNEVARSYIGLSMENKFEATQQARDWLEKQLVDMKAKVERSEEALNRFAAQNKIVRPLTSSFDAASQGGDGRSRGPSYDRLDELSAELAKG